jgi:hypothetical protein
MRDRDSEIEDTFNGLHRLVALLCIGHTRRLGLMTDEEFAGFSDDTRAEIDRMLALANR